MPTDFEGQPRTVRITDVEGLAVVDVDGRYPASIDEHTVEAAVVDRHPTVVVVPHHQVRAGDQRMGNAYVGAQIATDHHIIAGSESTG